MVNKLKESNYLEQSHKFEYIQSRLNYALKLGNELKEAIPWINKQYDRDINQEELEEFEKMIDTMKNELDSVKYYLNIRWTRF